MLIIMDAIYRSRSTEAMERKMKLLIAVGLLAATMSTALAQNANDLRYGFVQSQRPDTSKRQRWLLHSSRVMRPLYQVQT
jgi:hypothetical protein